MKPEEPTRLKSALNGGRMTHDFNLFLPSVFLDVHVEGLCICPDGYAPIKGSTSVKQLDALGRFFENDEFNSPGKSLLRIQIIHAFGEAPLLPKSGFKISCKCKNACGDVMDGELWVDRKKFREELIPSYDPDFGVTRPIT